MSERETFEHFPAYNHNMPMVEHCLIHLRTVSVTLLSICVQCAALWCFDYNFFLHKDMYQIISVARFCHCFRSTLLVIFY